MSRSIKDLEEEIVRLQRELQTERERNEISRRTIEVLDREVKALNEELKKCTDARQNLYEELKFVISRVKDTGSEGQYKAKFEAVKRELTRSERTIASYASKLDEYEKEISALKEMIRERDERIKALEIYKTKHGQATSELLQQVQVLKSKLAESRKAIAKLEEGAPGEDVTQKTKEMEERLRAFAKAYKSLKEKYEKARSELEKLKKGETVKKKVVIALAPPEPVEAETCPVCLGKGKVAVRKKKKRKTIRCPRCRGSGHITL